MAFKKKIRGKMSRFYYVDFRIGEDGDPRVIHINRSTRSEDYKEACFIEQQWRADAEEQYFQNQSGLQTAEDITLQQAIKWTWEERWQHNSSGYKSLAQVEKLVGMIGDLPLSQLSGNQGFHVIKGVRDKLLNSTNGIGRVIGKTTVDRYMSALKTVLKQVEMDLEPKDFVFPRIKMYNNNKRRERILEEHEERKLFQLMDGGHPQYADLFKVMLDTGLRISEVCRLDYRKDIFLDKVQIRLQGQTTDDRAGTKNQKPRTVPLTERAFKILKRRKQDNPTNPFPWSATASIRLFKTYRNKLGFAADGEFTPHMLRHTCTTRLFQLGLQGWQVQAWLGHSDSKMTAWYNHFNCEDIRIGAELLDQLHERTYNKENYCNSSVT